MATVKRSTDEKRVPVSFGLPGDVHAKAKTLAYKRGMRLREFMIAAIRKEAETPAKRREEVPA